MCGKRLKALLLTLVPALEHHGHLSLDPAVRERLLVVSAAMIDRRLASARAVTAGQRRRRRSALNGLRGSVPVRTFGDWKDPAPGFVEADLVAHCGGTLSGSFVWPLVLTDIASGWTECVPLLVREARLVVDALDHLRGALPFPLRGIDTDNGSEVPQRGVGGLLPGAGGSSSHGPGRFGRTTRPGSSRRTVPSFAGWSGTAAWRACRRPRRWPASTRRRRLFVNVLQPSFKLAEKTRHGGRVRKRYHAPETPCARLLALDAIPVATKDRLRAVLGTVDPLALLDEIRAVQHHLAALAAGATGPSDAGNVTPTSTGSCGASRSHGAPARCGRPIGLARDHPDTGAPGRVRSRRTGPESSSGWRPSRIGPRRSSSTASAGNSPGCSSPASFGPCSAASATGGVWPPVVSTFADPTTSPQNAVGSPNHSRHAERDRGGRDRARPGMPERLHRPVAPAATISVLGVPMRRRVTARTGRKGGNARQGGSTVASVGAVHDVAARRWDASEAHAGLSWEFAYIVPTQPQLSIPPNPVSC